LHALHAGSVRHKDPHTPLHDREEILLRVHSERPERLRGSTASCDPADGAESSSSLDYEATAAARRRTETDDWKNPQGMNPSMGQQNMGNMQGQSGGGAMMFNQQMQMIQHARESADESQPAENDANADYAEQLEAIAASGFEGELIPWVGDKVPCVLRSSASDPTTTQPEMHAQNGRMILNKNSKFKEN
jgi:hypothetical protein